MNSKVYFLRFRKRVSLRLLKSKASAHYGFKKSDKVFNGRKALQNCKLLCSNLLRKRCKLVKNQNIKHRFSLRSMANKKLYNKMNISSSQKSKTVPSMNKQSLNKKNVKSKTKIKAVGDKAQSKVSLIKGIVKRVVSVHSCKRHVKIGAVKNPNQRKSYVKKYSKVSKAGAVQKLKLVRSKAKVKRGKQNNKVNVSFTPGSMAVPSTSTQSFIKMKRKYTRKKKQSNKIAISSSVGNSAVPSTSKQSRIKKMVKSKIKLKSVGKKSQVKKKIKKVLSVCSRKRHIKINAKNQNKSKINGRKIMRSRAGAVQNRKRGRAKKRGKGTNSTNIDPKNKTSHTQIPSTSNQGSQASASSSNGDAGNRPQNTCTICLDEYKYPVKLPCAHTFCFLCAKGIILRDGRCALCRQIVPQSFLYNPVMVNKNKISLETNDFKWFYEGSNSSWWQYDDQSNDAIEEAFQNGSEKYDVMIAGFMYEINLKDMFQQRKYGYSIPRRIQRAKGTIKKRGIAGIEVEPPRKKKCLMLARLQ